jgi:hypothetical protein
VSSLAGRRWLYALAGVAALGFGLRFWYISVHTQSITPVSDAYWFHEGANLLADGRGFIDPIHLSLTGHAIEGAKNPPGFTVVLALASFVGQRSFFAHQVWAAIISTGTVVVVGFVGRRIAGPRVGLSAALFAAVYPNFFFSDALLLSETLVLFTGAITLLMAYRFWELPSRGRAAALGLACGVTVLSRSETVLLLVLLIIPAAWWVRGPKRRERFVLASIALAMSVAVMAPWVVYNLTRFNEPLYLSNPDPTLLAGNCDDTYYGSLVGYWSVGCIVAATPSRPGFTMQENLVAQLEEAGDDASVVGRTYREAAVENIKDNLGRMPFVVFAREGRTFGFYRPSQQLQLDEIAPRELTLSRIALVMYYALVSGMVAGLVILRRRRVPIFPLVAYIATVALTVAIAIGETRYRALAELPLVLGAAVGVDALVTRLAGDRRRTVSQESVTAADAGDVTEEHAPASAPGRSGAPA